MCKNIVLLVSFKIVQTYLLGISPIISTLNGLWNITRKYGLPGGSSGKESACNVGDLGLIPGLGKSPGEGKGYPPQYSGLENPKDCIVHGVTKSRTWLSDFHFASQENISRNLSTIFSSFWRLLHQIVSYIKGRRFRAENWLGNKGKEQNQGMIYKNRNLYLISKILVGFRNSFV